MTAESTIDHGLILHTSNRLESLADRLSALISSAPAAPFEPEVIVVQSQGMARWLQLELASRLGLCANVRFPFPRAFAQEVFQAFAPAKSSAADDRRSARSPHDLRADANGMVWPVWSLLPWLAEQPGSQAIAHYLKADPDGRKRYQLARRIARLFDDYAIFRPDLVLAWDAGQPGGVEPGRHPWQPILWRKLGEIAGPNHAARQHARCLQNLAAATTRPAGLPQRVSLFGISSLPPFHVDLFERLAPWCSVHFFLLQPAAAYWGDITSAKATLRQAGQSPAGASDLHRHEGNPLVASLGAQGRDFLNVLLAQTEFNNLDSFTDPGDDSILHSVQSDILHLRNPARPESMGAVASDDETISNPSATNRRRNVRPDDDSIRIHSCHSALRELEVLRDHLLHWLDADPTLAPRDILVMTPDIEAYAPLIDAVFADVHRGAGEPAHGPGPVRIPYSVADRGSGSQSQIIATFVRILHLAGSRLGASSVVELLETSAVRRRFELTEAEALQAREWLRLAGVRWGRDEAHRAALKLPALRANTWAEGLDRLLLGFAMDTAEARLFQGIQPCAGAEGQAGDTLGRLLEFVQRLFAALDVLEQSHPLTTWIAILRRIITDFFAGTEADEPELRLLREIVAELAPAELTGPETVLDEPLPLAVLLEHLEPALAEDRLRGGFLTGRVTFGALKPMRSIPFRIICLLGLNDSAFPRTDPRLGFDLMAHPSRLGDQSKREDDRYLFLETLLSARDRLHLSYVGQSIRDNSPAPPSVLVSELLDYLGAIYDYDLRPMPDVTAAPTAELGAAATSQPAVTPKAASSAGRADGTASAPAVHRRSGTRKDKVPANQLSFELAFETRPPTVAPSVATLASLVSRAPEGITPERSAAQSAPGSSHGSAPNPPWIRRHRLQAFSADYFGLNPQLFSFSADDFLACQALRKPMQPALFVPRPLPEPGEEWRTVDLDLLAEFFVHPARFLLIRRLDLRLPRPESELSEREPMDLNGLEYFELKTELLEKRLAGQDLSTLRPVFLASGRLPLGPLGTVRFQELCDGIEDFRERLTRYRPAERMEVPDLDLDLSPFRITGRFGHVTSLALLHFRPAMIGPKDRIRAWIRHLAWCASAASGLPRESVVIGEPSKANPNGRLQYHPLEMRAAREELSRLLKLYWRGLSEPLRFFPRTSLKFAEIDFKNADRGPNAWRDSLKKARDEWEHSRFQEGEGDDEFFQICFHHFDPLDGDFMALARQIGHPLLEHEDRA